MALEAALAENTAVMRELVSVLKNTPALLSPGNCPPVLVQEPGLHIKTKAEIDKIVEKTKTVKPTAQEETERVVDYDKDIKPLVLRVIQTTPDGRHKIDTLLKNQFGGVDMPKKVDVSRHPELLEALRALAEASGKGGTES